MQIYNTQWPYNILVVESHNAADHVHVTTLRGHTVEPDIFYRFYLLAEKHRWQVTGCIGLAVDTALPVVAVYSANSISVFNCSSLERVDMELPAHVHQIANCSFRCPPVSGDDVVDDEEQPVTDRAIPRLYFCSGVSLELRELLHVRPTSDLVIIVITKQLRVYQC